ncbi:uncharacterized protein LOC111601710 [Drosophila hydei]|uniref:lysozyme n=1 Tax=Drosophila hydei TaxID=7224 RepID=A0A6J2SXG0_DROHY|nr:uncharacterized protein LOC111601710 [Drosophila hydei]
MQQIPTWVCIAQHESSYNTAAVGRLNADGSADHGLFQISDLYWCTHDQRGGKGCHAACNQFLDTSIADDVQCIRRIFQEHTQISGDGFNAWTVYNRDCRNQRYEQVAACFAKPPLVAPATHPNAIAGGSKVSYAYPFAPPQLLAPATTPNPYYRPTHKQISYQAVQAVSSYQSNPFLRPRLPSPTSHTQSHPNLIGNIVKSQFAGVYSTPATNPLFSYKQYTTPKQQTQQLHYSYQQHQQQHYYTTPKRAGKVYKRCELAQELYFSHKFPMQDLATWVCIAEHESRLDTSAVGRLNADGSADHGLFQISDLYWCTHGGGVGGKGCHIDCDRLLDSDIADDVKCIRTIHEEHTRISGDGFTAWTVYNGHCRDRSRAEIASCFEPSELEKEPVKPVKPAYNELVRNPKPKGKIYSRCELAQELYYKHKLPMQEIPTWVCIAQHESSFNTAAVGRLNTDGSEDHGLFQISDLYWCTHGGGPGGKGCHIDCDRLLDSDITDDVKCIRTIHEEHTRLSGDGFTAWTVYNGHCRDRSRAEIASCFEPNELQKEPVKPVKPAYNELVRKPKPKGKIYSRCELAQELYYKHKLPMQEIPTWVCIAQHESSFNTAAVGRLNTDGSEDHGLFQISDLYWCTHGEGGGKACHIECDRLLDSDIMDDVQCIRTIHEEHTRISGDGFNAWTVYNGHCRSQNLAQLSDCFSGNEISEAQKANHYEKQPKVPVPQHQTVVKIAANHDYGANPFLQRLSATPTVRPSTAKPATAKPATTKPVKPPAQVAVVPNHPFGANPFLQLLKPQQQAAITKPADRPVTFIDQAAVSKSEYNHNPFLKPSNTHSANTIQATVPNKQTALPNQSPAYESNPFLSLVRRPESDKHKITTTSKPTVPAKATHHPYISSDSFRQEIIKFTATSSASAAHLQQSSTKTTAITTKPSTTHKTTTRSTTTSVRPYTTARPFTTARPVTTLKVTTRAPTIRISTTTARATPTTRRITTTTAQHASHHTTNTQSTLARQTTTRSTTRQTTAKPTARITTVRSTTQYPTTRSTARPTTRATTRSTTIATARPTTRYTTRSTTIATARPTTRVTTRSTTIATARPTTKSTTRSTTRATTRPTSRATTRSTTRSPTIRPTTRFTTAKSKTRSTAARATSRLPTTRSTTLPTKANPTVRSTLVSLTTRSTTAKPTTTRSTTRSTTRIALHSTATRPTLRSTTTWHQFPAVPTTSTARPTLRTSTTYKTTTHSPTTARPSTKKPHPFIVPSTTPKPYLFTTTRPQTTTPTHRPTITVNSSTTTDPFDHPFFAKFKAAFDASRTSPSAVTKPTTTTSLSNQSKFTASPNYAKFQENSAKVVAKTAYDYDFSRNRTTTTIRPYSTDTRIDLRFSNEN